ncbi:COG4223 family protein [Paracoccus sp. (in: a-proteobacteria)]|uniref:COG4223 family protein n=1 Tax=Paracoccus sp. TaxID=267 RepID=UPI0035AFFE5B
MKKPESDASENKATPGKDTKKKPVSGAVIDSHPVSASEAAAAPKPEAKPAVESKLVGAASGPDAAAPKAGAKPDAAPAAKPAASSVPPVAKSDAAKDAPKPEAGKSEAGKSEAAKSEPAKAASAFGAGPSTAPTPPAAPPSAPPSAPAAKVETRVVEVRKAGFMPTFLGGVIAAGLGAGAAYWAIPHLPAAWQPVAAAGDGQLEAARAAGAEAASAALQSQTEALATRAAEAGADAARQALADVAAPAGDPAGDAAALSAQAEKLAALEKTVSDLAARPVVAPVVSGEGGERMQAVLNELTARLTAQQQRLDELAARPTTDPGSAEQLQGFVAQAEALQQQIAASAAEAEQRIAAAESQASALQDSAEAANRRAQAATAAAALRAAIETGGSRDQALADLNTAGIEAPAVLSGDVPTLEQLRAEFPAAARAGLAAALNAAPNDGGALGVIGDFLRVQTGARSVEPREGNDPDAVLSRADAAVKAGDIRGALTGIATLPEPAQAAMADWTSRAQLWVDADTALATLASGSL